MAMTPGEVESLIRRVVREELADFLREMSMRPRFKGAKLRDPAMLLVWGRWVELATKHGVPTLGHSSESPSISDSSGAPPRDLARAIKARLQRYTVEKLQQALEGLFRDEWTKKNGAYDPMRVMRADTRVEKFLSSGFVAPKPTRRVPAYTSFRGCKIGEFGAVWDEERGS